jgi:hypothetical protein
LPADLTKVLNPAQSVALEKINTALDQSAAQQSAAQQSASGILPEDHSLLWFVGLLIQNLS